MKRIVTLLMAALLLAACQKEEPTTNPQPAPQPAVPSLAGTAWVGTLTDTFLDYPMTITYNLDFADDSTGSLYVELLVNGITNPVDLTFHYTFDGDSGLLRATTGISTSPTMPRSQPSQATFTCSTTNMATPWAAR